MFERGLWEEYSIVNGRTEFGIRKVVYPDGQQFTNEVFVHGLIWSSISEEIYAIQNKNIPYLLGNNEIKEYRCFTEDGSFKIIDCGKNDKGESLNSGLYESSDSYLNS